MRFRWLDYWSRPLLSSVSLRAFFRQPRPPDPLILQADRGAPIRAKVTLLLLAGGEEPCRGRRLLVGMRKAPLEVFHGAPVGHFDAVQLP